MVINEVVIEQLIFAKPTLTRCYFIFQTKVDF